MQPGERDERLQNIYRRRINVRLRTETLKKAVQLASGDLLNVCRWSNGAVVSETNGYKLYPHAVLSHP